MCDHTSITRGSPQGAMHSSRPPLLFGDLPLEMVALISDNLDDFDDLGSLLLTCHRLRHGALLSHKHMILRDVLTSIADGDVVLQREVLSSRQSVAAHSCERGLLRCLRLLHLSPRDIDSMWPSVAVVAAKAGNLDCLRSLITSLSPRYDHSMWIQVHEAAAMSRSVEVVEYLNSQSLGLADVEQHVMENIFSLAVDTGHLGVVQYLWENVFTKRELVLSSSLRFALFAQAATRSHLDIAKYLHHNVSHLSMAEFRTGFAATPIDLRNTTVAMLQFLFHTFNLDAEDARQASLLFHAAMNGNLSMVQFLHVSVGLTEEDARDCGCSPLRAAASAGHVEVVQYLHTAFHLTADDARSEDNEALGMSCANGHLRVVIYLHTEFNLTAKDARAEENYALRLSCVNDHLPVVQYLHTSFLLGAEDARSINCQALRMAADRGHLDIVRYLDTGFQLTEKDVKRVLRRRFGHDGLDPKVARYLKTGFVRPGK